MSLKKSFFKKLTLSLLPLSLTAAIFPLITPNSNLDTLSSNTSLNNSFENKTFQDVSKTNPKAAIVDLSSTPVVSDALAVRDDSIVSFDSYDAGYEDPNISVVSTMNGSIGMTSNKQTITFTTYDGLLLWSSKITENVLIQKYYKQKLNINDISNYSVINYVHLESSNILLVLFGLKQGDKVTSLSNEIVFGLDIKTGNVYTQPYNDTVDFDTEKNIFKVANGINMFYFLSNGNVVATTGSYANYNSVSYTKNSNTIIISFDLQLGFSKDEVGFNATESIEKDFSTQFSLYGIMPATDGLNYAIFYDNDFHSISSTPNSRISLNDYPEPGHNVYYLLVDDSLRIKDKTLHKIANSYLNYSDDINDTTYREDWLLLTKRFYYAGNGVAWFYNDNLVFKTSSGVTKLTYSNDTVTTSFTRVSTNTDAANNPNLDTTKYSYSSKVIFEKTSNTVIISLYGNNADGTVATYFQTYSLSRERITNVSRWLKRATYYQIIPVVNSSVNTSSSTHITFLSYVSSRWSGFFKYQNWTNTIGDVYETGSSTQKYVYFKKLNNIYEAILNSSLYKEKLPSAITSDELKSFVTFNDPESSTGSYTKTISNIQVDDNLGTLSFSYAISYSQQIATPSTGSSATPPASQFTFENTISISGMYALNSDFFFEFITKPSASGDATIDNKFKQINVLKANNIPSTITKQNIIDYFLNYSIKDKSGNALQIIDSYITLTPNDNDGTLSINIEIPSSLLPTGFPSDKLTYSSTYTGFESLSGYTKTYINDSQQITELKRVKYAREISLSDILNYFVTLGPSYETSTSEWTYEIDQNGTNDYTGTLSFRLIYTSSKLPSGVSDDIKNVFATPTTWYTISGFKTIYENFDDAQNLTIEDYSGLMSAQDIVDDYNANGNKSVFFDYLKRNQLQWSKALYIDDNIFDNLEYSLTPSTDGKYIDIKVGYKLNTYTTLTIGNNRFVFDSVAKQNFESHFQDQYPFSVKWNINYYQPNFEWTEFQYDSSNSPVVDKTDNNLSIDLKINSYGTISKDMYASDVTDEQIEQLFLTKNYALKSGIQKTVNSQEGTLMIKFTLVPQQTEGLVLDSNVSNRQSSNKEVEKTIYIVGFKLSTPLVVEVVPIVIAAICALLIIVTVSLILYRNKKRNDYLYLKNIKKKRK